MVGIVCGLHNIPSSPTPVAGTPNLPFGSQPELQQWLRHFSCWPAGTDMELEALHELARKNKRRQVHRHHKGARPQDARATREMRSGSTLPHRERERDPDTDRRQAAHDQCEPGNLANLGRDRSPHRCTPASPVPMNWDWGVGFPEGSGFIHSEPAAFAPRGCRRKGIFRGFRCAATERSHQSSHTSLRSPGAPLW